MGVASRPIRSDFCHAAEMVRRPEAVATIREGATLSRLQEAEKRATCAEAQVARKVPQMAVFKYSGGILLMETR